ncbi:MAG: hypothetical protein LBP57_05320 [Endomicrobium sp.]|jgi:hypothetical protein|nr:hypothetical protein [Endomicrobium sp.]
MKKVLSTFTAIFFLVVNSYALEVNQKNNFVDFMKKDTISFSTAYSESLYTNKQLTNVTLEFLRASDRLLNLIHENNVLKIVAFGTLVLFNQNAGTTLHEIGHGLRARSYGIDFMLMTDMDDSRPFTKDENYFNFFFKELFSSKRAACAANSIGIKNLQHYFESLGKINDFYNFEIVFSAGGINNNTYLSEQISNNIHFNNSSERLLPYFIYVNNLLYGALYDTTAEKPGDDPFDIIYNFNQKGRNDFQKGTIYDAGIKSLFLSATTYSFFYSFFTNNSMVKPYGFRLPDVFPYITTKGMSYKVVSGYEVNESLNLIFGFESVFGKEAATEINIGLNHQAIINKFPISYKGIATFGQGFNLEFSCLTPISKSFDIGLGCEVYSVTSLMGQRHATTNMKDGQGQSKNLFAFIQYRY